MRFNIEMDVRATASTQEEGDRLASKLAEHMRRLAFSDVTVEVAAVTAISQPELTFL